MGSHAQDQSTANAASKGAQAQDAQLAANAAKNQGFADQTRKSLFGNYDSTTGRYSGGTESAFLDPNSINQKGLSGSYADTYNNETNKLANNTKNAVGSTMQDLANRGMGKTPAGFAADQERKAYQTQAGQQGDLYSGARDAQHADATSNYWNATNMLNSNASQTANLSLQGNQAAAGNYANLYGTGSQQVQSGWGTALGAIAGAAGSAAGAYAGTKGCWIAEALWGKTWETAITRAWVNEVLSETQPWITNLYAKFGERVAEVVRTNRVVRAFFTPIFNKALANAQKWADEYPLANLLAAYVYGGE